MLALIVLATLFHWSPPTTGAHPQWYCVEQRDPWGELMSAWAVTDTSTVVTWEPMPYRLTVTACAVANGDTMCSDPSIPSAVELPMRWASIFWSAGSRLGNKGLSLTVGAALALDAAWPEEEKP